MKDHCRLKPAARTAAIVAAAALVLLLAGAALFRHFLVIDPTIRRAAAPLRLPDPGSAVFLQGDLRGCENLLPAPNGTAVYVGDLAGNLVRFDGADRKSLAPVSRRRIGDFALGLALDGDGRVYAAASEGGEPGWKRGTASSIKVLSPELEEIASIPAPFPSLNGICFDGRSGLLMASSNFSFLLPAGTVLRASPEALVRAIGGEPLAAVPVFRDGLLNGLCVLPDGSALAGNTLNTVWRLDADGLAAGRLLKPAERSVFYRKASLMGPFDDFCVDSRGRLWLADPINPGGISMFDPAVREIRRVELPDFGYASSCRIRVEGGREVLYVAEIRRVGDTGYNGRGVLSFPIDELR